MSEPRLISPLLDGFVMGKAISEHNGVRCCPAMQDQSDNKYIVKIISIPASQVHTDALLLSGAYKDRAAVQAYYKELADGIVKEAEALQGLSKLEGFLAHENWQIVPMENEPGYDVYLVGTYKRSLERFFSKQPMTHLGAVNLGLDLCAALAVCRQSGCLYVNLKPSNIFITDDQRYMIGDIGFIPMSSLKYASMPDRYRSSWTAPEIDDPFASLNTTIDIYAAGLILYQAYNNGKLPFEGRAPAEVLPPPEYADYEMAEIIMKACAPKPEDRWQDPIQMGQALVAYMQRNSVNDTPIIPPVVDTPPAPEAAETDAAEQAADEVISPATPEADPAEAEETTPDAEAETSEAASAEDDLTDLSFIEQMISDETAPTDESTVDIDDSEVSAETSEILAQADELIAHETPEGVVAPEPIEIPMPEPIVLEDAPEAAAEESAPAGEASEGTSEETASEDVTPEEAPAPAEAAAEEAEEAGESAAPVIPEENAHSGKKALKSVLVTLLCLLLASAIAFGGYFFYKEYYLQHVDKLAIDGTDSQFTVTIDSDIPDEKLTVVYTDTYGNAKRLSVKDGTATATDLAPSSQYLIELEIDGFHKLTGSISGSYTTSSRTNIVALTAVTGAENGSALVNFTVDGKDSDEWVLTYSAEGEEEKSVTFAGHMATIRELTVGKEYTFTLAPASELMITGATEMKHTASNVILAENLKVDACHSGSMTVSWNAPEGTEVSGWTLRCYNETGFDQSVNTTDTSAVFSGIGDNDTYTIEATAAGMTVSTHITMTSTPIEITAFDVDTSDTNVLNISWEAVGNLSPNGWILNYSIDGGKKDPITCPTNNVIISPAIPGARYEFALQSADGITVFNGTLTYDVPAADSFNKYGLSTADGGITFDMYSASWTYNYQGAFAPGETAYLHLETHGYYYRANADIDVLYVIRDASGYVVSTGTDSFVWHEMWWSDYYQATLPALPTASGSYTLEVFFDREFATEFDFSIA